MRKFALWSVLLFALCLLVEGCAGKANTPLPTFAVAPERLKETPPDPVPPTNGKASEVVKDPVKIAPEKAVGYEDLPATITQLFDQTPRAVSIYDVVNEALANNRQIKIQGYNLRIAEYQVPVAKSIYDLLLGATYQYTRTEEQASAAGFGALDVNRSRSHLGQVTLQQLLPTGATFNLAYTALRNAFLINQITPVIDPLTGATTFVSQPRTVNTWSNQTAFNISQPLLRGFGIGITNAGIRVAQLEQQGSAADFQTNLETQVTNALKTYWQLIGFIEEYKVQVIAYAAERDLLRVNTAKFNAGVVAKTEVLQAEAAAEARRNQLLTARQTVRDLEDQLKRQIFLQPGTPLWNVQILPSQPIAWREMSIDQDKTIQTALANRSEMRRAQADIAVTKVNQKVAKNNLLPQLNAFGQVTPNGLDDDFGDANDTMSDGKFTSYNAGLQFAYPLQNRSARYRLKQARARTAQSEEVERDLEDQITLEVRQAVRDLKTARERIDVTQSQIRSAQATLDAERKRLDVGISTSFQVLQFQQDVASAQSQHIRAVVEYNNAAVQLERARGTLLNTYGIQVDGADLNPQPKPVIFPVGLN